MLGNTQQGDLKYIRSLEHLNYNLVELCGKGYVVDNYIAFLNKESEDRAFRIYVTDALKVITKNTACKKDDLIFNMRWLDMVEPQEKTETKEERTADEVIADLQSRLLEFSRK